METLYFVHPTAEVSPEAQVGAETRIWRLAQVREYATIGNACILGKGVYVDRHVKIGSYVKIQNYVSLFEGAPLEDGVFIGPHVCFTNDLFPRATTLQGKLAGSADWEFVPTRVRYGALIGAGSVIVCGVTIGQFAFVGAGSVVTKNIPPHALVFGNPAHLRGYICRCANRLINVHEMQGKLTG